MLKFLHEKQIASFTYDNKFRPLNLNLTSFEKGLIYELGLEVEVDILNHQSYDALEWVIHFKNSGGSKTHNLSKILGFDSTVPYVESDEVFFESLNGDQCEILTALSRAHIPFRKLMNYSMQPRRNTVKKMSKLLWH